MGLSVATKVTGGKQRVANRWTPDEIAQLRDLAPHYSAPEIAEKLDRSVGGVIFKAQQINLSLRARRTGTYSPTKLWGNSPGLQPPK
jgi:hypothetical protein